MICGDCNHPSIAWGGDESGGNVATREFFHGMRDCFLHQNVNKPTHHYINHQANILDLVFTNQEGMVNNIEHAVPLGKSHHDILTFNFTCYATREKQYKTTYLYDKADFDSMRKHISEHDWNKQMEGKSSDDAWKLFLETFNSAVDKYIKKIVTSQKARKPLWLNEAAIAKLKKKHHAYRRYMETQEGKDYEDYAKARNQAKWECKKAVRDLEKKIAAEARTNPKAFFSYAKSKMKSKSGIADLIHEGETATTNKDKANMLNDFLVQSSQ